jgi:tetratricopeptide (TPR) repeat protein
MISDFIIIRKFIVLVVFFLSGIFSYAQNNYVDSLINHLKNEKTDTGKVNDLHQLFLEYEFSDNIKSTEYIYKALELSKKSGYKKGLAVTYKYLGFFAEDTGNYEQAINNYQQSLKISETLNDKKGISAILGNIGSAYYFQGDYPKALNNYFKALKLAEEINDNNRIVINLGNIGNVYKDQSDYTKALEYYFKALKMNKELGNKNGIAANLGNIGIVYKEQAVASRSKKDSVASNSLYQKALNYSLEALKINEELGDERSTANQLGNIGTVYHDLKNYPKALEYYFKALTMTKELEDKRGIASNLGNIGSIYTSLKKYTEAETYLLQALAIADSIVILKEKMQFEISISDLYSKTGKDKKAFKHFKNYIEARDTLINQDKSREIMNFEFAKKEAATKAEQEKKDALAAAESRKQKIIIWSVIGGLLLVIFFTGFIFRSLRITRKQKNIIESQKIKVDEANEELKQQNEEILAQRNEIEHQKHLIEEHQKEIVDSITYAKRIQDAILPPIEFIKEKLPNSFILYKPKDIVAGDFYWMEVINNTLFIAAADCTGHGVPGAMVSVVCSNALNRAVKEFDLTDTGKILDKITDLVLETFEKSSTEVKDGMDISLLSIKYKTTGTLNEISHLQWSGANNPLWYFQNNELIEIKADKQPIGKSDYRKLFTTHTIEYKPDSTFYLFTDGYADQFGGPRGKKFMYKQFSDKLKETLSAEPYAQQKYLDTAFENWKGHLDQVDDVTVIGICI